MNAKKSDTPTPEDPIMTSDDPANANKIHDPNLDRNEHGAYVVPETILNEPGNERLLEGMQTKTKAPAENAVRPPNLEIAEEFTALNPVQQSLAYRGSTSDLETSETLPGDIRLMSVTCKVKDLQTVNTFFQELRKSLPIQDNQFMGGGNPEEMITIYHLVPDIRNAYSIYKDAERAHIQATITVIDSSNVGTIRAGQNTAAIHPHFSRKTLPSNETTLLHSKGGQIQRTTGPIESVEGIKHFGKIPTMTAESVKSAKEAPGETPSQGFCEYLIIDTKFVKSLKGIKALAGQMSTPAAEKFIHFTQWNDYLVVISTEERAGWNISEMAEQISKATNQKAPIWKSNGEIEAHDGGAYSIEGFPSMEEMEKMAAEAQVLADKKSKDLRIFIPNSNIKDINKGRRSTGKQISGIEGIEGEDFSVITKMDSKIKLRVGGPDRLIGFEEEREALLESANPAIKGNALTILSGNAGTGKSRLLDELEQQTNTITISFDPSRKNVPFGQLAMAAEQIAVHLTPKYQELRDAYHKSEDEGEKQRIAQVANQMARVLRYAQMSQDERIKEASNNPSAVINHCTIALQAFEQLGAFTLIVDDVHHIDRFSDGHVMNMVGDFLNNRNKNSKVVMAMRPEERYQSKEQAQLERKIGGLGVNKMMISPLDFQQGIDSENPLEDSYAYQFIYYSIREEKRTNSEGQPRVLGEWYKELAGWANTPLELSDYMDEILSNPKNIVISENRIDLKDGVIESIREKGGRDTQQYNINKVRALTKNERSVIAALAMLPSTISSSMLDKIIRDILKIKVSINPEQTLIRKGLLLDSDVAVGEEGMFRLKHDTLRSTVLKAITDSEKRAIAKKLETFFASDKSMSADVKLGIAQFIADSAPLKDSRFWLRYASNARETLQDAEDNNQYERAYGWATGILGEDKKTPTTIKAIMKAMAQGSQVPMTMRKLVEEAIVCKAKNGLQIGKEEDVYESLDFLEKSREGLVERRRAETERFQGLPKKTAEAIKSEGQRKAEFQQMIQEYDEMIKNVALHAFDAAYYVGSMKGVAATGGKVRSYHELLKTPRRFNLSPSQKFLLELKSTFKEAGNKLAKAQLVKAFYEENAETALSQASPKEKQNAQRIYLRIKFEAIRFRLISTGVDDDTLMKPEGLSEEEITEFFEIKNEVDQLIREGQANPEIMSTIDELALLEQKGQVEAFLGHYKTRYTEASPSTVDANAGTTGLNEIEFNDSSKSYALDLDYGVPPDEKTPDSTAATTHQMVTATSLDNDDAIELSSIPTQEHLSEKIEDMGAIDALGECWRIAMQAGIYPAAARAAKMKGDLEAMQAISVQENFRTSETAGKLSRSGTMDPDMLKKAVETYKQGLEALGSSDKDSDFYPLNIDESVFYHLSLRINRIRSIGLLCENRFEELLEANTDANDTVSPNYEPMQILAQELAPYIEMAFEDFAFINKHPKWKETHTDPEDGPETAYCLSYIGPVLGASIAINSLAKKTGVEAKGQIYMHDSKQFPSLSEQSIDMGINHIKEKTEDSLGEVENKGIAYERLIQAAMSWSNLSALKETDIPKTMQGIFGDLEKRLKVALGQA